MKVQCLCFIVSFMVDKFSSQMEELKESLLSRTDFSFLVKIVPTLEDNEYQRPYFSLIRQFDCQR